MKDETALDPTTAIEAGSHLDVAIIGAGISGIDAAYHLQRAFPDKSFAMLEKQAGIGGTWRTHRFPGIRSDSDLFTFGLKWKPWTGIPIATAPEILSYLNAALDENDLRRHIRFGHGVTQAQWSSDTQRWTVTIEISGSDEVRQFTCSFLWMCSGYYDHAAGFQPDWPGQENFKGPIVHPQTWPDNLDYAGKKVVVIGSGATAATLIPAMAETAAHVTMLQRSPTYFFPKPMEDEFSTTLKALNLPDDWFHEIMRRKFLHESQVTVQRSFSEPDVLAEELIGAAREYLGPEYDIDKDFRPSYRPWRQRIAMVPDGDLFVAIAQGRASVVTDRIMRFCEGGLELESGAVLEADVIVSATGLVLNALGDVAFEVDGAPVDQAQCWTHRGVMLSGVPNLAMVFGYLRTSWTMRADLVSDYVCRVMEHMTAKGVQQVTPVLRAEDADMPSRPYIDPENFNAGYIMRGLPLMARQGDRQPWLMTQDYFSDRETLPTADLEDGTLVYR